MKKSLLEQLKMYKQTDFYPFHMPGHKRNERIDYIPVEIDITEIDGFDNLHHAEGVLKQAQERAARLYGAEESFFLVNGSTSGILAAISGAVPAGGRILLARNCHKAAYHAVFLRNLKAEYIYPDIIEPYGICGGINPNKVEELLQKNEDIRAVFLTSPTYEGMISDIEAIADIVHRNNRVLIVDEAHGAHLGIVEEAFPKGALSGKADIVIQSLHKTLPSLTQTAVLHVQGDRVDRFCLRKYLQIYQTSSPSYVFMAGMDSCVRLLEKSGTELFAKYRNRLDRFYREVKNLAHLHVLNSKEVAGINSVKEMDPSKICIFTTGKEAGLNGMGMTGAQLYQILLEKYHLQMEMTAGNYVLAMTSIMDTDQGFERLSKALFQIDKGLAAIAAKVSGTASENSTESPLNVLQAPKTVIAEVVMTASEAEDKESQVLEMKESLGRISKEYRYVYPPGVPVLVPGEKITAQVLEILQYYEDAGLNVLGQEQGKTVIEVIK